jgi:hypothetical protein
MPELPHCADTNRPVCDTAGPAQPAEIETTHPAVALTPELRGLVLLIAEAIVLQINSEDRE